MQMLFGPNSDVAKVRLGNSNIARPPRLYRIGELVRCTALSRQTIHNYTTMGLIPECGWTDGGHRLYDDSAFERLSRITELKKSKTLTEITRIFSQEQSAGFARTERSGGAPDG